MRRREVGIARTHGKAIGLPDRGQPDDLDIHIQILHHPLDGDQLLVVFLAEEGQVRLDDVEELGHHRGHTAEVSRAGGPAEVLGHVVHLDGCLKTVGVHLPGRGVKANIHTDVLDEREVPLHITRILCIVLARPELRGVDEDADDQYIPSLSRLPHEREMPFVQIPHGGDKGNDHPLTSVLLGTLLHLAGLNDDLHGPLSEVKGLFLRGELSRAHLIQVLRGRL